MKLHFQRTSPSQIDREQAFTRMSQLAAEGIALVKLLATRGQTEMWWEGDGAGV